MARRLLAIVILLLVAIVAIRIVVGAVIGLVHAVLWIAILAALVVATFWAWRQLNLRAQAARGEGERVARGSARAGG